MFGLVSAITSAALTSNMLKNLKSRLVLEPGDAHLLSMRVLENLTLAVPVRDEEQNLSELLPQLVDQQVQPKRIVFLDDQSRDKTAALIDQYASRHPNISRVAGQPLPAGWRGKVWALHQLLRTVETEYVMFVDADVRFDSSSSLEALWNAAGLRANAGFVSVFPRPNVGLGASMLVHQIYTHLYYFLPFNASRLANRTAVAGCGQVMIFKPKDFESLGGYGRIRASTHDGLQLARIFKGAGRAVITFDGGKLFSAKMYPDFATAFRAFSRNDFEATNGWPATLALSALLFWVFVLPFFILPVLLLHPAWLIAFLFMLYGQVRIAQELDLGALHVALTPVKGAASIAVHLWSTAHHQLGIKSVWRNRLVGKAT